MKNNFFIEKQFAENDQFRYYCLKKIAANETVFDYFLN